jgi:putative membrane protein
MWNGPYGMICDWSGWGWDWPLAFLFPLLFWALVIAAIVMIVRSARRSSAPKTPRLRGLDVLAERYARSEIDRDEFVQKTSDIIG